MNSVMTSSTLTHTFGLIYIKYNFQFPFFFCKEKNILLVTILNTVSILYITRQYLHETRNQYKHTHKHLHSKHGQMRKNRIEEQFQTTQTTNNSVNNKIN